MWAYSPYGIQRQRDHHDISWAPIKRRCNDGHGYIRVHIGPYTYVPEHILVVERELKCCMLPWGLVHHKNGVKTDNRIENLQPMMHPEHMPEHRKGKPIPWLAYRNIPEDRLCAKCGLPAAPDASGYIHWRKVEGQFYCNQCGIKVRRHLKNPNMQEYERVTPDRTCVVCQITAMEEGRKGWTRIDGGGWHCNKCRLRKRTLSSKAVVVTS